MLDRAALPLYGAWHHIISLVVETAAMGGGCTGVNTE